MSYQKLSRDQIAQRVAQDIPDGAYVNLGIGLPTKIASYLPEFVTMLEGGSFFHHGDSFAMMRGGHLDIAVLGAFQVAANGDLANWHTGAPDAIPAVGGAMDLAVGAKKVFITTDHVTKQDEPKIVAELTYPVTGKHCVDRIYTDLCVIDVTRDGLKVIEKVEGLSFDELQALTGATLIDATQG
ncbi:CoA-transferase [Acinetobacter baumannii]